MVVRSTRPFVQHGGLERASQLLNTSLAAHGNNVVVYTPISDAPGDAEITYVNVPWPRLPAFMRRFAFPLAYALWNKRVRRLLLSRANDVDVILFHGASVGAANSSLASKTLLVSNPHGMEEFGAGSWVAAPSRFVLRRLIRRGARFIHAAVATDPSLVRAVEDNLMLSSEQVVVIPNVVDLDAIRSQASDPTAGISSHIQICSVGRMAYNKGYDILAKSLTTSHFDKLDWQWIHYGSGPRASEVLGIIQRAGARQRFTHVEAASDDVIYQALANCDLFVQPSRYEGSSLTTLEAMASGCIVVATPVGGIPDKIVDGVTGFLAEDTSVESVSLAIKRGLGSPDRSSIRSAAASFVTAHHSPATMVSNYSAMFESLLATVGHASSARSSE